MTLILLMIFLAVSLGILASAFVWSEIARRDQTRAVKRLSQEFQKAAPEDGSERLFKSFSEFELGGTAPLPYDATGLPPMLPFDGDPASGNPGAAPTPPSPVSWRSQLRETLRRADLQLTPRIFLTISVGAGLAGFAIGFVAGGWVPAAPALLAGLVPWLYVRFRANARRDKLLRQLPAAFDLMARVLKAGLSMPQAFQGVAEAFENPISSEFGRCRDEQNLGVFPEVAFRAMADRTGVLEMKIFVMAMLIQKQTGGNLSEVLERLAGLIRERLRLRNHIRTLTAEGRLQAVILLVLPFVMFAAMRVVNAPYTDVLLAHPEWLVGMGVLMGAGAFWIRRIIDIE